MENKTWFFAECTKTREWDLFECDYQVPAALPLSVEFLKPWAKEGEWIVRYTLSEKARLLMNFLGSVDGFITKQGGREQGSWMLVRDLVMDVIEADRASRQVKYNRPAA
jgi:hypothetical protein